MTPDDTEQWREKYRALKKFVRVEYIPCPGSLRCDVAMRRNKEQDGTESGYALNQRSTEAAGGGVWT